MFRVALAILLLIFPGYAALGDSLRSQVDHADQHADMPSTLEYARHVAALIKGTWGRLIERQSNLAYGTVLVHASVDRNGEAHDVRIITDSPEKKLAPLALRAVSETKLPGMSARVVEELHGKRLAIDITFDFRPLPNAPQKRAH